MFWESKAGKRKVCARERRTIEDWAHEMKRLWDEDYPSAKNIIPVCDNFNTHKAAGS
jgi:hypothetical protein